MYYLQSRYYNPEWGRFINADALGGQVGSLLSHNIFAYCQNNVANMGDPSGFMMVCMSDYGGISKPSTNKNITLKAAVASSIAAGDKIFEKIADCTIKTGKKLFNYITDLGHGSELYTETLAETNPIGAGIKKIGKIAGLASIAYSGTTVINDIIKGEYYSAVLDIASFVIGVGIGIGVTAITGALITISTPALLAGFIGVIGFGATVGLSMGVDYFIDKSKNKYYGRQ